MNIKKIASFAIGPIGGAALGFITLPIITWYFSVEDIGRIALLNVILGLCTLFFSFGLDQAYVREYHEYEDKSLLFKMTILPGLLCLLCAGGILVLTQDFISVLLFDIESPLVNILIVVCVIATFIARFLSLILRMQEKGLAFSMSQLLPKILFLFVIGFYILKNTEFVFLQLLYATTASILFVCLVFAWNTRNEWTQSIGAKIDKQKIKEMLKYGVPLIFGGVAYWGLNSLDRFFLKYYSDYTELGIYSVSVSFAAVAVIIQSVFSTVWAPTVYKWVKDGENLDKIHQVSEYILYAVVAIFSLVGMFSWIIDFILPAHYADVRYIVIACLGAPLLYTLSETTVVGINVMRKTKFSLFAACGALVVSMSANILLIPAFGATGAAISSCIAFFIFFILRTEFSILVWKPIPRLKLYFCTIIAIFLAILSAIFKGKFANFCIIAWFSLFVAVLFLSYKTYKKSKIA